jgi:N2-(2-carboxyethyl)arginine synthase
MLGSDILLNTLVSQGVDVIYGIVGREAEVISFDHDEIEFILTHDERSAAFMADVHGRITCNVGVCYSTFGPGATNLATGIASAFSDRSPMLAISAQVESDKLHYSTHQYINQVALMRPITKYACEIKKSADLQYEIEKAIDIAKTGIPGPCFLSIPLSFFQQKLDGPAKRYIPEHYPLDSRCVRNAPQKKSQAVDFHTLLKKSEKPLFIIGHAMYDPHIYAELSHVLECVKAPFFTTYSAKGLLSPDHPCCLGTISNYLEYLLPEVCQTVFSDIDLVVFVGVDMVEGVPVSLFERKKAIYFCALNSNIDCDEFFQLDFRFSIPYEKLLVELKDSCKTYSTETLNEKKRIVNTLKASLLNSRDSLDAANIIATLQTTLSKRDVIVSDVGLHKQYLALFYDVFLPKRYFCSNGLGSMGFGLPAAIAAKRLYPDDPVVLICGDGGFHLSSAELETSVRYSLPIVIILFYDRSLGLIRHYQKKGCVKKNTAITHYGQIDFVKLAEANGCCGIRIKEIKELSNVLSAAIDSCKTTIIEIPICRQQYV